MIAADALRTAIVRLQTAGVQDAPRDARLLLAHAIGIPSNRLTLHLHDQMIPAASVRFEAHLAARASRQPVSQIIGQRLFWGRSFAVTPDVLDPRPETETLIAGALQSPASRILDLGTGSGVILLTLLAEWPGATGQGADISQEALDIAVQNAANLSLTDRAAFQLSDWFSNIDGRFDLIVSNPPYITASEMAGLAPEVHDWEPHIALTPGGDGLAPYRAIAASALDHLTTAGRILVECGPSQGRDIMDILALKGFRKISILTDMDARDRVVAAEAP